MDAEKLHVLSKRGINIEVYVGKCDTIINALSVKEFFVPFASVYFIKRVGHILKWMHPLDEAAVLKRLHEPSPRAFFLFFYTTHCSQCKIAHARIERVMQNRTFAVGLFDM